MLVGISNNLSQRSGICKRMKTKKSLLVRCGAFLILWATACPAFSQTETARSVRPATQVEVEGAWQLVGFPPALEPKLLGANPWPSECQWFAYKKDGVFKSLSRITAPCPPLTAAILSSNPLASPANLPDISWKFETVQASGEGYIVISRSDKKSYHEIWQADIVQRDFQNGDVDFLQGDLILSLVDPQTNRALWYRHLRRIN